MTNINGRLLYDTFVHRLYPNKSTKVSPLFDRTAFVALSRNCLLLRRDKANLLGGVKGWVWGYIWAMLLLLSTFLLYYFSATDENLLRNEWFPYFTVYTSLWLGILPFLIVWRLDLPICFNRKTRKVSCWIKGSLAEVEWDKTGDNARTFRSNIPGQGRTLIEQSIGFEIYNKTSDKHKVTYDIIIPLAVYSSKDPVETAKGLWEYIRVFMDEGKEALPQSNRGVLHSLQEVCSTFNPFPSLKYTFPVNMVSILLLPFSLPISCICILTDIMCRLLNEVLPRRNMPEALKKAYEAI